MKLRIQNYTAYRTVDLRRFFTAGLRAMVVTRSKTIEVRYRSGRLTCSRATLGAFEEVSAVDADGLPSKKWRLDEGRWIRMLIGKPSPSGPDLRRFARVFEHEVLHNKGVGHREMTPAQWRCDEPLPKWADGLVIRLKEVKAKPTAADRVAGRAEHAREMLAAYERKQKRVATLLKKWRAKVRYYERRAAAKAL